MPRHVCLVTNRPWLIDGRIINHARTLAAAGFRVTIADCGRPPEWNPAWGRSPNPAAFLPCGCTVRRIEDPTRALPPRVERFVRRQLRWWLHAGRVRQLAAIGAQVYQAADLLTARYCERVGAQSGARVVYDIRDLYSAEWNSGESHARRRAIAQEAEVMRRAAARLTVCDGLARLVAERYRLPPPQVIRSCRDPVPPSAAGPHVRSVLGLDAGTPLLVHTGHSEHGRAFDALVAIVRGVPGAHLALVGQEPGTPALKTALAGAEAGQCVHVLPPIPAPEVPAFIRTADAAVIYLRPVSLNMQYALPNKFFEAVAAGLPLAISDGKEFRPLVSAYQLGVLFDPADVNAAIAAVNEVLRNRQRYRQAAALASEQLSWQRESGAYLRVYRDLLPVSPSAQAAG